MNETGGPVGALVGFYKVPPSSSSSSTTSSTSRSTPCASSSAAATTGTTGCARSAPRSGSGDFYRVRVGVGRPPGRQDAGGLRALGLPAAERTVLPFQVDRAADAVESLLPLGSSGLRPLSTPDLPPRCTFAPH